MKDLLVYLKKYRKESILEQGDHESLLAKNGFYAQLYKSQFAGTQT